MRILVLHNLSWKTWEQKMLAIKGVVGLADIEPIEFVEKKGEFPPLEIENGRITHRYFDHHFKDKAIMEGYHGVLLCMNRKQGKGLQSTLRGSYHNDDDPLIEGWIVADEKDEVCIKKTCINQFVKSFLHELRHGLTDWYGLKDDTHDYDFKNERNNITGAYKSLRGRQGGSLIEFLKARLGFLKPHLSLPIPPANWSVVTQPYLNPNPSLYPKTGVHPGTDFRGKISDPILATCDGAVTRTGFSPQLGNWLEFKQTDGTYLIALHLQKPATVANYKRGEVIGVLGDTGLIKGVHYHLEGWYKPMDRSLLTSKDAVIKHTFDVLRKYS